MGGQRLPTTLFVVLGGDCIALHLGFEVRPELGIDERVHRLEAFEGVFAVEHAGAVHLVAIHKADALAVLPINRCTTDHHGERQAALVQFLDHDGHLLGRTDQQRRQTNGVGTHFERFFDDGIDRDLLAQVIDGVAVVGQNRVDQVFADVVHVAIDRGEDHFALAGAFEPVEVTLQMRYGLLHDLGTLQHKGQNQLPCAEQIAHLLHRRQQHVVEHGHGLEALRRCAFGVHRGRDGVAQLQAVRREPLLHGFFDVGLDAFFFAVQDFPVQTLVDGHAGGRIDDFFFVTRSVRLVELDVAGQGVFAFGENQIFAEFTLVLGNLGIWADMARIDNRGVEPSSHGVEQKDRVQRCPGMRRDAEAQIADAQGRKAAGDVFFDQADAVEGLDRSAAQFFLAGGDGESEHVEDQRLGRHPKLLAGDGGQALGDLELALGRMRHARLVDGHRHRRRAVAGNEGHDFVDFLTAATLERYRVDDGAARVACQGCLEHVLLGGVDDEGKFNVHGEFFDQRHHLFAFVAALGHGHTDIEHVRAAVDLFAGHFEHTVVVVVDEQAFDFARAQRIDALADHGQRAVLLQCRRADARRDAGDVFDITHHGGDIATQMLAQFGDVGRARAAAATDDADTVFGDELTEGDRKRLGLHGEHRRAVDLDGQAGIGDARNGLA